MTSLALVGRLSGDDEVGCFAGTFVFAGRLGELLPSELFFSELFFSLLLNVGQKILGFHEEGGTFGGGLDDPGGNDL